ncbi:MAG: ribosome maturation factor RimM [Desulfitobacteriaceae bacterium]|nr:ribosome maturation factor RimM [Desulfitobacteriaceae bacterium]MDD4345949.1 ribosome maturation factor RimM [Desulfitobacteriaceae bacterium]MDD4401385.1 ribosome maturation factor RimM [Desulfitobacteriaceae bacterium]
MDEVLIGEVLRSHGLKGELKIYPLTHNPARFKQLKEIIFCKGEVKKHFTVDKARIQNDYVFLSLAGLSDMEQANSFQGWEVRIDRSEVAPLKEGWYYFELEGMKVFQGQDFLGTIIQVIQTGANDVYLVKGPRGEICVPALKSVVKEVDVAKKRMEVVLLPGLLEG